MVEGPSTDDIKELERERESVCERFLATPWSPFSLLSDFFSRSCLICLFGQECFNAQSDPMRFPRLVTQTVRRYHPDQWQA